MIHFEITKSPDSNVLTSFKFHKNEVYIGKKNCDLHIQDPLIFNSHLLLEIPEDDLVVHPQREVSHYLLNGKRSTSVRKIKSGDCLTIGETVITIIEFKKSYFPTKKEILNSKLAQLIKQNSPRLTIIEKLTNLMK